MTDVSIKISINTDIRKILEEMDLYKSIGTKNIGEHSSAFKKISRTGNHIDIYRTAIQELDYEILLKDDSIFQFAPTRYAFIQNPNISVTKEELLSTIYTPDELINIDEEEYNALLEAITETEIEQFKNEQNLNIHAHMIRYDIDEKNHKPLQHAYAHLHIGNNDNIRIPCSKLLTPLTFVLFVLKHTYAIKQELYEKRLSINKGDSIPAKYWSSKEQQELYLI